MPASTLSALSPLDGRYAAKVAALRPLLSEYGLMHRRVQVEVEWFIALSDAGLDACAPLAVGTRAALRARVDAFSEADAEAIKAIERTTNHDVKAVEYWLRDCLRDVSRAGRHRVVHPLRLHQRGHQQHQPRADAEGGPRGRAAAGARRPCRSADGDGARARRRRDAEPDARPDREPDDGRQGDRERRRAPWGSPRKVAQVELLAKMNGAVGNYNAHLAACPEIDWPALARAGRRRPAWPALQFAHDADRAARRDRRAVRCAGPDAHDPDRPGARHLGLRQPRLLQAAHGRRRDRLEHDAAQGQPDRLREREGNLGLANALLTFMSQKLPISRFQRDLTDSTVLRNMGVALGHAVLAYDSLARGLGKLEVNRAALEDDLDAAWEVLAEPIQTGDAPSSAARRLRAAEGADARPRDHARGDPQPSSSRSTSRPTTRPAARADAGNVHRPGGAPRARRRLTPPIGRLAA
jgi:adenylosuccinate lyase